MYHPNANPTKLIDFTEVASGHAELGLTSHTRIGLAIALQAAKTMGQVPNSLLVNSKSDPNSVTGYTKASKASRMI